MSELEGKVALVTGGARGQGRSHALALAAAGAAVVVCDIAAQIPSVPYPMATREDLDETVAMIEKAGGRATASVTDVRDGAAVSDLTERVVRQHGRLDILIANAGITSFYQVADIPDAVWSDTLAVNLTGAFHCIRAALPHMAGQRYGRIVAISSGAGRSGMPNLGHYGASKWGLIGLIKTVAAETARQGITANVVCPTTVNTPMVVNDRTFALFAPDIEHPTADDVRPRMAATNPMGEPWIEPEDVTRAVMYLVTDPGRTSGAVLEVSLGMSAART
ncbi:NAD(P)-dependent oxidoreductase [Trebonia kvetii]|uniref:NAD(P)-dependent oxidoreductase n=1 Tax=Trebonia kvetii TaxID=2480626 RepID=A0A6P2BU08_9ACTN|nr:mycofactocin-coupled SDR family oxidoreductase [Trebonia kvetii]TVZ02177.1 NAD(P)-dependent oxidoreductase [Trebonia kvetii]